MLTLISRLGHDATDARGMMDGGMGGMWGPGWVVGMVLWSLVGLALLVLAVVGIVWLVRRMDANGSPTRQRQGALDVLRRRYAAGEIDEEEYRRRLAILSDDGP